MMRLTWKDALATGVAGANVAVYVAFTQGADVPIIDSVRGATATILLLGLVGGCSLSAAADAYERKGPYMIVATTTGGIALVAGVTGLIVGSELALAVLFYATMALWLMATVRHAIMPAETEVLR
ncbi:hypothetical protein HCN51_42680 [Nonomuraea sp. FMUSA5-5]|uniref:Uncharacterized protein n=1 Tax=Nonomuraea composti TaxID=2720023 RepID=A0ABX1BE96_9ACTN|nr:hypothetical protein [Nonomuraea sp. FMUSA5-5]NJP96070.1 hypothetical protein [Nonomuraea sp. FMUSA5-5]